MATISIIIPTHNRSASLRRSLNALTQQNYPLDQIEVIVVADGCSDDTVEILKAYQAPFTLHWIEQSGGGAAIARNSGAARATAPLLLFLDDDIEASPDLVAAHVQAHHQAHNQVVIGYLPTSLEKQTGFFRNVLRVWWEAMFQKMRQIGHRYSYRDLLSGNFSVSAKLFNQVNGFDPNFKCHEDYELGYRLLQAKADFNFAETALGYHYDITDLDRSLQRKYQEGRADVLFGQKYPELKATLPVASLLSRCSLIDRILLLLIFRLPAIAGMLAFGLRRSLDILEWLRLQRYWQAILDRLLGYWYLRGIAEASSSQAALNSFFESEAMPLDEGTEIEVDLKDGLEVAEQRLTAKRPDRVRLRYGQQIVGYIAPQLGTEPLRGEHLRPVLSKNLTWILLQALAIEETFNKDIPSAISHSPIDSATHSSELIYAN